MGFERIYITFCHIYNNKQLINFWLSFANILKVASFESADSLDDVLLKMIVRANPSMVAFNMLFVKQMFAGAFIQIIPHNVGLKLHFSLSLEYRWLLFLSYSHQLLHSFRELSLIKIELVNIWLRYSWMHFISFNSIWMQFAFQLANQCQQPDV